MKKFRNLTKAELIKRIQSLEKSPARGHAAFERERLLHNLQVHQIELETQNEELRKTHHLLELSRDRYADLYDGAPVGYVTLDEKGVIQETNLTAAAMLGVQRLRLVGMPFGLYVVKDDLPAFRQHLRSLARPDARAVTELGLTVKDRGAMAVEMQSVPVLDPERRTRWFRSTLTDITRRKQAEETVRNHEARLRVILETAVEGIIIIDEVGSVESFNGAAERMFGYAADEVVGKNVNLLMPSPYRQAHDGYLARYLQTGERKIIGLGREVSGRRKDGSVFPLDLSVSEAKLAGQPIFTGIVRDITDRKRQEQRRHLIYETSRLLAASQSPAETVPKLLQILAESIGWDIGEFWETAAKPSLLRMTHVWHTPGRRLAAFVNRSLKLSVRMSAGLPGKVFSTRKPYWIPDVRQSLHFARKGEADRAGLRSAMGFPIELNNQPLGVMTFLTRRPTEPDEDLLQMLAGLGGQIEQFIKRKEAEAQLRASEDRYRTLLKAVPDLMFRLKADGTYIDFHAERAADLAVPPDKIIGMNIHETGFPPDVLNLCLAAIKQAVLTGRMQAIEYDLPLPEGKKSFEARIVKSSADDEVVSIIRDITDRKRLEKEVLEISEREQRRIGQDLHDGLCQHLAGIEFRLIGLKQKLEGKSSQQTAEAAELAQLVRQAIEDTRTLAHGLSPVMLKPDGLMNALQELAANTEKTFDISCSFNCPAPIFIHDNAVATHLYRIAQEAVHNAIRHGKAKFVAINLFEQNERVVLGIRDDGVGIAKKPRQHKGMGLRVMQYRAGMVGGSLVVQRMPGGGTSVVCSLRLAVIAQENEPKRSNDSNQ